MRWVQVGVGYMGVGWDGCRAQDLHENLLSLEMHDFLHGSNQNEL